MLFADRLRESCSVAIQSLEYRTKLEQYELLEAFMMSCVFPKADEESAADLLKPEHLPELQIKRRVLTGYLKLIFHNVMPMMRACIVFQYYESVSCRKNPFTRPSPFILLSASSTTPPLATLCGPPWSIVCR